MGRPKNHRGCQALTHSSKATLSYHSSQDSGHQHPNALGQLPNLCTRARVMAGDPTGVLGSSALSGGAQSTPSTAPHLGYPAPLWQGEGCF